MYEMGEERLLELEKSPGTPASRLRKGGLAGSLAALLCVLTAGLLLLLSCALASGRLQAVAAARTHLQRPHTPAVKAYVISSNASRWKHTSSLLARCGLQPILVNPVPLTARVLTLEARLWPETTMSNMRKTLSNKLTHIAVWRRIGADAALDDGEGFSLVFEDDVSLNARVQEPDVARIVRGTAARANDVGLFYLGICGLMCDDGEEVEDSLSYRHCRGRCAHAYGVHKWRAPWLYEELAASTEKQKHLTPFFLFYADVYLHFGSEWMPDLPLPVLAGANLKDPRGDPYVDDMWGIFFQDRALFPPQILT
jgi:hypothetical protein